MDPYREAIWDSVEWALDKAANIGSLGDGEDDLEVFVDGDGRPFVIPYREPVYLEGDALKRWKTGKCGRKHRGPASRSQRRMIYRYTGQQVGRIPLTSAEANAVIARILRGEEVFLEHTFANGSHLEKRLKRVED